MAGPQVKRWLRSTFTIHTDFNIIPVKDSRKSITDKLATLVSITYLRFTCLDGKGKLYAPFTGLLVSGFGPIA